MSDGSVPGTCLCGKVRFEVTPPFTAFRYCHCSRCRKASGSGHAANLLVPRSRFRWLAGQDSIRRYDVPQAQRFSVWFCTECGSRAPHEIRTRDDMLIPAGLLDADPQIRPQVNIFWDSKAEWCADPEELPRFAEYPPA
ncbi:MAG TPA: GFA family protein [Burkholderiales bacterium]|nr:GFA family protein [Burkholderiales bacterium]